LAQHISDICVQIAQCTNFYMKICIFSRREVRRTTCRMVTGTRRQIWRTEYQIEHNLLIFSATSTTFCMEVHMDRPNKLQINWLPNHKTGHNSLIAWATESRFCMEVHMDSPNKLQKKICQKQNGRQITKLTITHSIFI